MTNPIVKKVNARGRFVKGGYMGLKTAYHTYLVESENHQVDWPCFGGGYMPNAPGLDFGTFEIFIEWAKIFVPPNDPAQYTGGMRNTVNGTCHTIGNRILALSNNNHANISASVDDKYSVMAFGKYGAGTTLFLELLRETAIQAAIPEPILKMVIDRVTHPEEDEMIAWAEVVQAQLNIDALAWLNEPEHQAAKKAALAELRSWGEQRNAIYAKYIPDPRNPSQLSIDEYRAALLEAALFKVENFLKHLAQLPSMNDSVEQELKQNITHVIESMRLDE